MKFKSNQDDEHHHDGHEQPNFDFIHWAVVLLQLIKRLASRWAYLFMIGASYYIETVGTSGRRLPTTTSNHQRRPATRRQFGLSANSIVIRPFNDID